MAEDESAASERELSAEERAAIITEHLKALHTADVAHDMVITLVTLGYQKLGLTAETRELRNLGDARLAIEVLRGIVDAVARVDGEQSVGQYRSTVAQMQLQYARAAAEDEPGAAGPAAGAAREAAAAEPQGASAGESAPADAASEGGDAVTEP